MAPPGYPEIPTRTREIRLLHLLPGHRRSTLFCTISATSLDSPEPYTALSYTWGSPDLVESATLVHDGQQHELPITKNLADALQHLRSEHDVETLWIDGICIDQSNTTERNHQVKLMRFVYQQARRVLVWLGPGDTASDSAMNGIEELSQLDWSHIHNWGAYNTEAISQLLRRPWFSRVWVRQEVRMSRIGGCTVRCGDQTLDILKLKHFLEKLRVDIYKSGSATMRRWGPLSALNIVSILYSIPYEDRSPDRDSLDVWLELSAALRATEPRDHVFGILGLTPHAAGMEYLVDYAKSVAEVFCGVVEFYIRELRSVDILLEQVWQHPELDLPTWTPDWTPWPGRYRRALLLPFLYKACGCREAECSFSIDLRIIQLKGFEIGEVVAMGEQVPNRDDILTLWRPLLSNPLVQEQYGPDIAAIDEAFWRTVVTDYYYAAEYEAPDVRWPQGDTGKAFRIWTGELPTDTEVSPGDMSFEALYRCSGISMSRGFVVTSKGHIGVAAPTVRKGDLVCVIYGGNVPYLLRRIEDTGKFEYVGEVYIHGIMDGEALDLVRKGEVKEESFTIV